ncbi:THAP domain-containing protein 4 [Mortierella sp. AD011]|nr:THAP domain-containing protein 4 [Mortierella sp. AD010]KAF9401941.1 THAP domain-containing protein 4 [Mortierella sp. AD011]
MSPLILLRNSSPNHRIFPFASAFLQKHVGSSPPYTSATRTRINNIITVNMSTATDKPRPLEFLIGTWAGKGKGFYPNITTFDFFEEVTFVRDPAGRPVIAYNQKTKRAVPSSEGGGATQELVPGSPLHAECGYIRLPGWSEVECELILSQPTGVASVEVGKIEGTTVDWTTTGIIRSPKARPPHVTQFTRKWVVDPAKKTLSYTFSMATDSTPLQPHLEVLLQKVEA